MQVRKTLRLFSLMLANFIAAYLSLRFLGGVLVFGAGKSYTEFSLFAVPVLAFPIALTAWWNVRLAAFLWLCATVMFFGTQIYLRWPQAHLVATNGTHFLVFLAGFGLLLCVVALEANDPAIKRNGKKKFVPSDGRENKNLSLS